MAMREDQLGAALGGAPSAMAPPGMPAAPMGAPPGPPRPPETRYDPGAIVDLITRKREEWSHGRSNRLRPAYRNLLFLRGRQWIRWDRGQARYRDVVLPPTVPMPVTNRYASTMAAVISVFARIEPRLNFLPATDDTDDRAAARVAGRVIEVIESEVGLRMQRQYLAQWVGHTGDAWVETGYDPDPRWGTRLIPDQACPACALQQPPTPGGQCAACGAPTEAAVGPDGQPLGQQVPIGRMYTDVVSCFEMFSDPSIADWTKQRECLREKSMPLDHAKERWPELAERLQPDSLGSVQEAFYQESLATLGAHLGESARKPDGVVGLAKKITETWFWQLPTKEYPEGLLAITLGKNHQLAHAGPLPYHDSRGQPFLPFTWFPQQLVPGSGWSKTVADDVALKQAQRNRWESIIELAGMSMGNAVWLLPEGANVVTLTGHPGQVIRYSPLVPAKPERVAGQPINGSFVSYLEKIDQDLEELAATFDVIKGSRPEGVSAGIALQILNERGQSRFAPLFITWESAWAAWGAQAVDIFREYVTEPRLLQIMGRDGQWEVEKFLGADLEGHVNVVPEAGSAMPRTNMAERAEIEQLVSLGIVQPLDPEQRFKILEIYGRTKFVETFALDAKNAVMEDEAFAALAQDPRMQQAAPDELAELQMLDYESIVQVFAGLGVQLPRVRPSVDDHGIHSREHGRFLKGQYSQTLPPLVQMLAERHKAMHDQLSAEQMMAMQQAQGGGGGTPQRPGAPPGRGAPGRPNQNPMNAGSSPARMEGEFEEMGQQKGA
jgi:hypothetical protein